MKKKLLIALVVAVVTIPALAWAGVKTGLLGGCDDCAWCPFR